MINLEFYYFCDCFNFYIWPHEPISNFVGLSEVYKLKKFAYFSINQTLQFFKIYLKNHSPFNFKNELNVCNKFFTASATCITITRYIFSNRRRGMNIPRVGWTCGPYFRLKERTTIQKSLINIQNGSFISPMVLRTKKKTLWL